jgi:hypothetical protein
MTTQVIRIYGSAANAAKAAQHLSDAGFDSVAQFKAGTGKGAASRSALVADMLNFHIWKSHAEIYADRLGKGEAMVAAHAPFGSALKIGKIMDKYDPVGEGIPTVDSRLDFWWDDAAPLSSALQMPVLTNMGLTFETLTGISSLTKGSGFLSKWLGMPLLSAGVHRKQSSMGLPMLSSSATPLSSAIGMRTLSSNPTPLSSMFGLKVLSARQ